MHKEEMFTHDEPKIKRKKTGGRVKGSPFRKSDKPTETAEKDAPAEKEKRTYNKSGLYAADKAAKKTPKKRTPGESFTFLFFTIGKEEYTEIVADAKAEDRAQEIFADPDYKKLEKIFLMQPIKLFNRPVMNVVNL